MNWIKATVVCATTWALVGCGGGSNAGTSVFTPSSGASSPSSSASSPSGSASSPSTAATALTIALDKNQMTDISSDTVVATITAVDANRNAIANAPITVAVDNNAIVHVSGAVTDSNGNLTATISPGQDLSNRSVTITASSGSIKQTATFQVSGAQVAASVSPSAVLTVGQSGAVRVVVTDHNNNALPNQKVTIAGTGIPKGDGTTDAHGEFDYAFTAPSTPGNLSLTITAAGLQQSLPLQVQAAAGSVPAATTTVLSPSVSANPTVVGVNTANGTTNQTTLTAVFVGANNARVPNVRVRFDLNGDPNSVGGAIGSGTELLYSDANGVASTTYTPATIASPTNGVSIRACWDYNDFAVGTCPNQVTTTLTVVSQALKVSIGTNNKVGTDHALTFYKDYVVVVNDAAGQAVKGVLVTPSLDLSAFHKGYYDKNSAGGVAAGAWYFHDVTGDGPYSWTGTGWQDNFGAAGTIPACPNEDENRNGVLETGEDLNQNGKLDPSGVTITALDSSGTPVSGGFQTDASGLMTVRIEYPRNYATWVDYVITVTAKVAATEGKAVYVGTLVGAADELTDPSVAPSFVTSPFGITQGCGNAQ